MVEIRKTLNEHNLTSNHDQTTHKSHAHNFNNAIYTVKYTTVKYQK